MTLFAIRDIKPNPFRNIDHYPIKKEKVEALRESLRATGFWDNVVARMENGKPEIAYGHHRLAALREEYKPGHKVALIIKDLDNRDMIRIMARENMEEWKHSAEMMQETVKAIVGAYTEGKIDLPAMDRKARKDQVRYAPSFVVGDVLDAIEHMDTARPYTIESLAKFLEWTEPNGRAKQKLRDAVLALEFIELGILSEKEFEGLTVFQARAVVEQASKSKRRQDTVAETFEKQAKKAKTPQQKTAVQKKAKTAREEGRRRAKAVGKEVSKRLKTGKAGYRAAAKIRREVDKPKKGQKLLWIDDFAEKLQAYISGVLDSYKDPKRVRSLEELIENQQHMRKRTKKNLVKTLHIVANRLINYADQIDTQGSAPKQLKG